ncbi:hypothetical protein LTR84_013180 [Exophiala bonariae]|uniref:NTF2-like domain-containing protein n=1 Tax=Exophiala bonariae TaxID=1690606 RepID=A0AAV9NE70_9EURO|nr:hypothetical protein LTR84_013180 [Exophiala bonariae]
MKLASTFIQLASVVCAAAAVLPRTDCGRLSQAFAEDVVAKFITILNHPDPAAANATAQALLADGYQEISDSILSLEGQPLGGITFEGKQGYIEGVLAAPPVEGITTNEILVAGSSKILWYWTFYGIGSGEYEVKGFNLFTITEKGQISTLNLEFNSIAWGLNTGYQIIFPEGGGAPTK